MQKKTELQNQTLCWFWSLFCSYLSCTKIMSKHRVSKLQSFQVHNKYRAPLDSALLISTDKSTTWTYPSFFERSQRFERATTALWPEFQNIVQNYKNYGLVCHMYCSFYKVGTNVSWLLYSKSRNIIRFFDRHNKVMPLENRQKK